MMDENCSRRDFLRKFAYLSSGALVLSAAPLACYGPPRGERPAGLSTVSVSGLFFLDAGGRTMALSNGVLDVPLHTKFSIEFTDDMNTSAPAAVSLSTGASYVDCVDKTWETVRLFTLTPAADLSPGVDYALCVDDAEDAKGNKIQITKSATAVFRTVVV